MAKIDLSKITGYADMSAEDKIKALEAFEYDDNSDVEKYKNLISKANSEAAEWKKKHNALLSDDQRKEQEQKEQYDSLVKELESLKKEKTVSEHKAKFLGLGYNEALATETATALADGDLAKVFSNQQIFLTEREKAIKAEALKSTPTPPAGGVGNAQNYEKAIADAIARNDMATASAYMRLQQQNTN